MSILSSTNTGKNFFSPRTKEELKKIIEFEIDKNGHTCSLNHIDVSKITDMSFLFFKSKFGIMANFATENKNNKKQKKV
jgi:hypothetical protein